ncbi:MAG: hypothetical protein FWB72_00600 [Firmicutes bacterium]|nr:hypothetical protein [Bacillota bacterium]
MTTINITQDTNWQEVAEVLKSKGKDEVIVMSKTELDEHTEKAIATNWLMAEIAKGEDDIKNGRFTSYTAEDFKSGKFLENIINMANEIIDSQKVR